MWTSPAAPRDDTGTGRSLGDTYGTCPFEDVKKEIKEQAWRYYHLVMNPYSTKGKAASAQHSVVSTMDIYESFHLLQRNST
jgi:hypothetical protein